MSNLTAAVLAFLIIAVFLIDALAFGGHLPVFLGRQFADLVEYLSFWR